MAHDEALAERIRDVLPDREGPARKRGGARAGGGGGHRGGPARGRGGLMLRCDPAETDRWVAEPGVTRMEMRGKEMDGWLRVTGDAVADDGELGRWVGVGTSYAGSLPPKG